MRFRIHRGATVIGGNCIEVQSGGKSLLLDLGLPLEAGKPDQRLLPPVEGLVTGDNSDLLGVVISHPHSDHYGLLEVVHPSVPVYIGDGAWKLLEAASAFTTGRSLTQPIATYRNRDTFGVGPFRVTPYLMDHSAFDAYALLIEADGKRLLYSGDFRGHGRKAWAFDSFLSDPPSSVDVLLMEGTVLGRQDSPAPPTEDQVEADIAASIAETTGIVFACFSAQNIDRLVTFYRATIRSGRSFIADAYTANILDALGVSSLPSPSSPSSRMKVYLPKRQKARIMRNKRFDLVEPYRQHRVFASNIGKTSQQWVMMFRSSMIEDAEAIGALAGGKVIWSLWPGYLDREKPDLRDWAKAQGMGFEIHHTSGHAHVSDLARFVDGVGAKRLVPIHTMQPHRYAELFPNVIPSSDGEWSQI